MRFLKKNFRKLLLLVCGLLTLTTVVLSLIWYFYNKSDLEPLITICGSLIGFFGGLTIWDIYSPKPEIIIMPTNATQGFLTVDDKNLADGKFKVEGVFLLSIGKQPLDILSIKGEYLVNGLYCRLKEPKSTINKSEVSFDSDWETLAFPKRIESLETVSLVYSRLLQPPIKQYPYDCEVGVLKITMGFKSTSSFQQLQQTFCFETSRRWDLTAVDCITELNL